MSQNSLNFLLLSKKKVFLDHFCHISTSFPLSSATNHRRTSHGGGGGGSPPPSFKLFGQNAQNVCNKETIFGQIFRANRGAAPPPPSRQFYRANKAQNLGTTEQRTFFLEKKIFLTEGVSFFRKENFFGVAFSGKQGAAPQVRSCPYAYATNSEEHYA